MNWFKTAKCKVNADELDKRLKSLAKSHPFFLRLLAKYKVPVSEVDKIKFDVADLGDKHAEADAEHINFNQNLFDDDDFFENKIFFFVHEFYHWVKRIAEKKFYFNDPEELESFVLSIAWQIIQGKDYESIKANIYPIVKGHFDKQDNADNLFNQMYEKAQILSNTF